VVVLAEGVGPDDVRSGADALKGAVAALHEVAAAADGELLTDVVPAVGVHVEVLDRPGQPEGVLQRVVRGVRRCGVVDHDLVRP
jgi:hypothetical protein